jgi:hypothetical protein
MRMLRLGIVLLVAGLAQTARADALLDQVIAGARSDADISWRVDRLNTDMDALGKAKEISLARFTGTSPAGTRWSLVSVNGKQASDKARATFSEKFNQSNYAPTYGQIAHFLKAGAERLASTPQSVTYRVKSLPAGTVVAAGYDLSKWLQADVIVDVTADKPFVSSVAICAPVAFKPASIAKVEKLDRSMTFALGPQGYPVLKETSVHSRFKVLVKNITLRTHSAFQNQTPMVQTAHLGKSTGSN